MTSIAQTFSTGGNYTPTKCELFLRSVGDSPSGPFIVGPTQDVVIDAPNYSDLVGSRPRGITFNDDTDFTGSGYITCVSPGTTILSYVVQTTKDAGYALWLRIKCDSSFTFTVLIDGNTVSTITSGASSSWSWQKVTIVLPDLEVHQLQISLGTAGLNLDKLYITKSATVPTLTGPDYTLAPYVTCHVRLATTSSSLPSGYVSQLDGYSTYDKILTPDWYPFDLRPCPGQSLPVTDNFAIVGSVSGSSIGAYIVWDQSVQYTLPTAINSGSGWAANTSMSMAVRVFSSLTAVDEYGVLNTPPAKIETDTINDFTSTINPDFNNTFTVPDGSGNDVELNMGNKLISFVVDMTGSSSWTDQNNLRLDLTRDIIETLQERYPANLNFNLFTVEAAKTFSFLLALNQEPSSTSPSDIIRQALLNDSYNFSGFRVVRKQGSYSTTPIDGDIVMDGYALAGLDTGLTDGIEYFYTVYTYDQYYRYSEGIQLSAVAANRILPHGIPGIQSTVYEGYGCARDTNTVALWNMDEGTGNYVFDFSNSELLLTLSSLQWLANGDSPIGMSGLRFNGNSSQATSQPSSDLVFTSTSQFSVIGTIFPMDLTNKQVIVEVADMSNVGWTVVISGQTIGLSLDGVHFVYSSSELQIEQWNDFGVVFNAGTVNFYINGMAAGATTLSGSGYVGDLPVHVGWTQNPTINDNFGSLFAKLTHLSVHNIARDLDYINTVTLPSRGDGLHLFDNGDRVVELQCFIPEVFDYVNYQIVVNRVHPPDTEVDGEVVYSTTAVTGQNIINLSDDFDLNHTYIYRIFTQNALGNWCPIEDATIVPVGIPDQYRGSTTITTDTGDTVSQINGPGFGDIAEPTIVIQRSGNEKFWLTWTVADDPNISRVVVYYDPDSYPKYDPTSQTITGTVVCDVPKDITSFVHRKIPNNTTGYYAIVTTNKLLQFSSLVLAEASPSGSLDDSGIPLLEAINVNYHIVDDGSISITWDCPVTFNLPFSAYFDETYYVYGAICDLYGNPLPITNPSQVQFTYSVSAVTTDVEDVFGLNSASLNLSNVPISNLTVSTGGLLSGIVRLRSSNQISAVESISLSFSATYYYSSTFTYQLPSGITGIQSEGLQNSLSGAPVTQTSTTTQLAFTNPLTVSLINRDNLYLNVVVFNPSLASTENPNYVDCEPDQYSGDPDTLGKRVSVNAAYIRRTQPFWLRAYYSYKGQTIQNPSVAVAIYDDLGTDFRTVDPCSVTPDTSQTSQTVQLSSITLTPTVDQSGSYTDLPVQAPYLPQSAAVFVEVSYNGFTKYTKINLFFASILCLSVTASSPNPDSIDVREQYVSGWTIDPDDPNNSSKTQFLPDDTIAQWSLNISGTTTPVTTIPFYSTDDVPVGGGVFSYFRNGTASDVFIGPITTQAAGDYDLVMSTNVQGLFGQSIGNITITGATGIIFGQPVSNPEAPRILSEFRETAETIYADGVQYIKMWIWRDPRYNDGLGNPDTSKPHFQDCFLDCSSVIVPLPVGQIVTVNAKGFEVIWGGVDEVTDPFTLITTLDVSSANITNDTANVLMSSQPFTNVYFRSNQFIDVDNAVNVESNDCGCDSTLGTLTGTPFQITTSTKINYAGAPLIMVGGGSFVDGRPPTIAVLQEPLQLNLIGVFINDVISNEIVIDAQTENTIVVEAIWENAAVPDGTPVTIETFASVSPSGKKITDLVTIPSVIYTTAINDPTINPTGNPRSFAKLVLPPFPTTMSFALAIALNLNYNAVGTVQRQQQVGVEFSYFIEQGVVGASQPSPSITSRVDRYDVTGNTWSELPDMTFARAGHSLTYYNDKLFAVSGTNGAILLSSVEEYDFSTGVWTSKTNIPTPRIFAQTVVNNNYIYVIGGMAADSSGNLYITGTVERYDMNADTWVSLSGLPSGYEIAFGVSHCIGGSIYVLSGYKNALFTYSDAVLTYNVAGDSWSTETVVNSLYSRLLPFSFVQGSSIYVASGLNFTHSTDGVSPSVSTYLTDAYQYTGGTVSSSQRSFSVLPVARFDGQVATIGTDHYCIGGYNNDSNTLRYIERINSSLTPFDYLALSKMSFGRSSFGATAQMDEYGDAIYVAGGVRSSQGSQFLRVITEALPQNVVVANGLQSAAVGISVVDENNDSPSSITVQVTGKASQDPVIFDNDVISVSNGSGIAILTPRAFDPSESVILGSNNPLQFSVNVGGTILDAEYYGQTGDPIVPEATLSTTSVYQTSAPTISTSIQNLVTYSTIVNPVLSTSGNILSINNVGGFLSLSSSVYQGSQAAQINYVSSVNWLPRINTWIDTNAGGFSQLYDDLNTIQNQVPFGGSAILDGVYTAAQTMGLDGSGAGRITVLVSDGFENESFNTASGVTSEMNSANETLVAPLFHVVPSTMYLDKGIGNTAPIVDTIATNTGGQSTYVTVDTGIDQTLETIMSMVGFVGYGEYDCIIDLGTPILIQSIEAVFETPDTSTSGKWQFSLAGNNQVYSIPSDFQKPNTVVTFDNTIGRFLKFKAVLTINVGLAEYGQNTIIPPKLTGIIITYHQPQTSYIFLNGETITSEVSQIAVTFEAAQAPGNEIEFGVSSYFGNDFSDFYSASQPYMDNNSRVTIPVRTQITNTTGTLEALNSIDGFAFVSVYGSWPENATVVVYEIDEYGTSTTIDPSQYKAFPSYGYVVFDQPANGNYVLSITPQDSFQVVARITNRNAFNPVTIYGGGFMYTTLEPYAAVQSDSNILPQADNLLLVPMNPNPSSVFTAIYSYYDISGYAESGTQISWYIHNTLEPDLNNLVSWDNKVWNLAKAGNSVYFTVTPANAYFTGITVRSLPVTLTT